MFRKPLSIPLVTKVRRFALVSEPGVWGDFVRLNQCQPACSAMGLHSGGIDQGTLNTERLLSETELTAGRWAVFLSTGILFSPLPPRIFLLRCRVPV